MNARDATDVRRPSASREADSFEAALARVVDGLGDRRPFLVVTGPPGTGKSRLLREAVERWGARARPSFVAVAASDRDLMERVLRGFGAEAPPHSPKSRLRDRVEHVVAEAEGSGRIPVIVVDDAHDLCDESLRELESLARAAVLAYRPLEILLAGRRALDQRLAGSAHEFLQRSIAVRCRLDEPIARVTPGSMDEREAAAAADPVPVESHSTDESAADSPAAAETAPIPAARPGPEEDDPRIKEWVARFIAPDQPRFGELLRAMATGEPSAPIAPIAAANPRGRASRRRPSTPRRGDRAKPRGRRDLRMPAAGLAAVVVVLAVAAVVLLARHRPAPVIANGTSGRSSVRASAVAVAPPPTVAAVKPPAATRAVAPLPLERFALDAGTYVDRSYAESQRDWIVAESGLDGWIVEAGGDSGPGYRVVLGTFRSPERARASARRLEEMGLVSGATVIPLPSARSRR